MKRELIIAIIIVITIFSINAIFQNYTKVSVSKVTESLNNIKNIAEELNNVSNEDLKNSMFAEIDKLKRYWQERNRTMSYYIEHDELEKVNSSMVKFESYLQLEEYTEGIPELENCKYILKHIQEKQSINTINFF